MTEDDYLWLLAFREAERDVLYKAYGDDWRKHARSIEMRAARAQGHVENDLLHCVHNGLRFAVGGVMFADVEARYQQRKTRQSELEATTYSAHKDN